MKLRYNGKSPRELPHAIILNPGVNEVSDEKWARAIKHKMVQLLCETKVIEQVKLEKTKPEPKKPVVETKPVIQPKPTPPAAPVTPEVKAPA